jgi:TetR/AcrR family transcriptional regulator, cholesterol catabolism regulator
VASEADKTKTRTTKRGAAAGRTRPGRANGARREQEVLDAATKVFYSRGYSDASVQDIADELGILKGSLYYYIDSKEDLLFRLLDETHEEVQAILEEVAALEGVGPLDRLREYFGRQVAYTTRNLAKMAIYYHDLDQLSAGRRKDLNRKRRVHEKFVIDLIEQAKKAGEVDSEIDANLTVNYLFGSMIWVYRWYKPGGKFKTDQVSQGLADFVTRSLGARS